MQRDNRPYPVPALWKDVLITLAGVLILVVILLSFGGAFVETVNWIGGGR